MEKISCIYIIKNIQTGGFYLGSTADFLKRKRTHLRALLKNKHHSKYLQNSFNKYGADNFEINIYQYCFSEETLELENYYLKLLKPKYNVSLDATCPMLGRKHSKETLVKLKQRQQPKGVDSPFYGRKLTLDHINKVRAKTIGSKRSPETRKKMSLKAKEINSISRIDFSKSEKPIKDQFGNVYKSLTQASRDTKHSIQSVCDNLKGRSIKTRNGYKFNYV